MEQAIQEAKDDAERFELLIWASARGLLGDVTELINQGANPDAKDKQGYRPVHYAASKGHLELLQYLSTKGIDLEAEDQQGRTPLYLAATWGHADCVKFLLTKSVWVDSYDSADCTALHKAARAGHVQVVKLLLGHGAKIEQVNNRALTPLGEAVASGRDDAAAVLLQAGADISTRPRGHTLLQLAAGMGSAQLVKLLVKAGCQVDEVAGPEGLTALHAAALSKDPAAAEALMQLGADASITSSSGQVAADLIDEDGSPATRQLLNLLQPAGSSGRSSSKAAAGSKGRTAAKKTAEAAATAAGDGDSQLPYAQRFASQPRQEQLRKVEAFARMSPEELSQLDFLGAAARQAVAKVKAAQQAQTCWSAVVTARQDADFQADLQQQHVRQALADIQSSGGWDKYAQDAQVMAVMRKLHQLQNVLRMNGGARSNIEELTSKGGKQQQEDAQKVQALQQAVALVKEAAADVICGPHRSAGAAAAESNSRAGSKASSKRAAEIAADATPGSVSAGVDGEGVQEQHLTWQERLRAELRLLLRQGFNALLASIVVFVAMWAAGKLPHQQQQQA